MTDEPERTTAPESRPVPTIPPNQSVDEPPNGKHSESGLATPKAGAKEVEDPKEKQSRWLELARHYFAMCLAIMCLLLMVIMAGVAYAWPRDDLSIVRETVDVLKILATASLGYLFGQAVGRS